MTRRTVLFALAVAATAWWATLVGAQSAPLHATATVHVYKGPS